MITFYHFSKHMKNSASILCIGNQRRHMGDINPSQVESLEKRVNPKTTIGLKIANSIKEENTIARTNLHAKHRKMHPKSKGNPYHVDPQGIPLSTHSTNEG